MKILDLKIESDNPNVVDTVIGAMKNARGELMNEVRKIGDKFFYNPENISHKDILTLKELVVVMEKVSEEIENCENGTKMLEG